MKKELPKHAFIWLILFFELVPLTLMVIISVKDNKQFFNHPFRLTFPWHLENWAYGWTQIGGTIFNTLYIAITATAVMIFLAVLAAYFFARFPLPGRNLIWALFLTLMLMPSVVNLIPLFNMLKNLHLLNSLNTIILIFTAAGQTMCVYLLRGFIEDIPRDLFEAAEMDGAGHFQQVLHVVVPMSMPILSTLAILRFIHCWNEFVLPLVVLRDEYKFPIGVKLYQLEGVYVREYGPLMASYAIAAIPLVILFVFTMRFFVKGISAGAIKG